jgi:hypothetical protein
MAAVEQHVADCACQQSGAELGEALAVAGNKQLSCQGFLREWWRGHQCRVLGEGLGHDGAKFARAGEAPRTINAAGFKQGAQAMHC